MSSCVALLLAGAASSASAAEPLHEPFRVMTYNVRQVNAADTGAYTWENRSPGVIEVIADNDPDIFGVQESSSKVIQDDLVAAFDAAYDRFQPTNGSPKTIFFRRARFERLVMPPEDGQGNIGIPNPYPEDHACFDNANGRTAAWVKLRDLVSGRGYLIVNAHVAHGSACYKARNLAADALHALIGAQSEGLGVVLFGDLNSDPQAAGASGDDDIVELLEAPQPGYRLARSARHSGDTSADTATFNSAWKAPSNNFSRLDYIFTKIADATTYHQSVDRREVDGITPSDHFAVLATIRTAPFGPDPLIDDRGDAPGAALAFADVTGDGAADKLVWNSGDDLLRVYPSDGAGEFGDSVVGAAVEAGLWFADVDGDGCADRIERDEDDGALRVGRALCDGSFAASAVSGDLVEGSGARLYFARLDADACADRMAWDPGALAGRTRIALSRCDGGFDPELVNDDPGTSTNTDARMDLADVNGDGLADKIVWDPEAVEGRTRVYAGVGDGSFTLLAEHTGGTSGVAASRFFHADVDADGHADKLFWRSSFRQGHPQLYLGRPDGFDPSPMMVNAGPSESADNRYFLADIDASGSHDLIAWDAGKGGATRAYLALVHAPAPPDPPPDDTTGGEPTTTGDAPTTGDSPTTGNIPSSTGDDAPTTGTNPPGTTDAASSTAGASDSGSAAEGDEAGCACTQSGRPDPAGAALLLFALGARRRRRPR
ncbi:FG-GAP-like repeat-containing protein [Nannocystis pusilla]|uniref:FG-GAP-like repeat-containing protein n=1 Tax=Nannocystis pusilla TaxID=889268 RepID=UPI003DA21F8F